MLLTVVYEELESDRDRECQNANKYSSIKFRSFCLDVDFESILFLASKFTTSFLESDAPLVLYASCEDHVDRGGA